jgi:hypothetical protein
MLGHGKVYFGERLLDSGLNQVRRVQHGKRPMWRRRFVAGISFLPFVHR